MPQKPPPFAEFTVFGQPSHGGRPQNFGVRECLQREVVASRAPLSARHPTRPTHVGKLAMQIEELETRLRGRPSANGRSLSARSRFSPRQPAVPTSGVSVVRTHGARRPLTSVSAYRQAGLTPNAWPLTESATAVIESWRACPKYEEQMLLGHLKSAGDRLKPPPPWKMRRFQMVGPRV